MARIVVLGGLPESLVRFRGPLLAAMAARGHEVFACAPDAPPEVVAELGDLGVEYRNVSLNRTGLKPMQDLASLRELSRLFRHLSPDVFLGYTIKPVVYGSLAARHARVPRIYSMITGLGYAFSGTETKRRLLAALSGLLYKSGLRFNERVFFQNPDDLNFFRRRHLLHRDEQAVLLRGGTGVDPNRFSPRPYPDTTSFLMTGRLLWDKGVREYVEAARIIHQRYPHVRFRLVGPTDSNPASVSDEQIRGWRDEGVIEYLGRLDDVRPALEASSVFVLPSYREGLPVTILEAMAMARPVITTDAPGCRETVREGANGFLVKPRDAQSLATAMERFILDPPLVHVLGAEGRRVAEHRYDVHKVNARLMREMELG